MILLIDNYDSFSYNLYQLIGSVDPDIQVVRNDEISLGEIEKWYRKQLFFPRALEDRRRQASVFR